MPAFLLPAPPLPNLIRDKIKFLAVQRPGFKSLSQDITPKQLAELVGLIINMKLIQQDAPTCALSNQDILMKRDKELYRVLSILKKLDQLIS